jgi:hypothetical protein
MILVPVIYSELRKLSGHFTLLIGDAEALGTLLSATVTPLSFSAWLSVAGNLAKFQQLAASGTAMAAVIASGTAMAAVAASGTVMANINANDAALNALYASPLITKVSYTSAQVWSSVVTLRAGIGLFVRLTTKAGCAGWGNGSSSNEWIVYDGTSVTFAERTANPYNHTETIADAPRHPARRFATSLAIRPYQALEIAYIPLTA